MTPNELYKYYLTQYTKPSSGVSPVSPLLTVLPTGEDSFAFSIPTKEEAEYAQEQGMQDVGENKFGGIGGILSTLAGFALPGLGGKFGKALSMGMSAVDPNSIARQTLSGITNSINLGFNPFGSQDPTTVGPFGGYNGFDGTEDTFSTDTSDTGATQSNQNSVDTAAQDADQSGGPASSTSGADPAGDGGDGYAYGGRVGFANGTEAPVYRILADGSLGPRVITDSMVKEFFGDSPYDGEDLKKAFGEYITFMSDEGYQKEKALNQQLTSLPQAQGTDKTLAQTLFPQGNFLNIRETATSPTQYNIEATKDLVENLPGFIQPFAPAAAGIMSIPYDAIQAYQRMQPGSGVSGFAKTYAAERPLQSAFERFVGASGPLAENINKAVSSLNPFQQQQYMQYATQNPEQAREAAQRNQDFIQAVQRGNQATGGRVNYLQGGLTSLLGNYYGKR